MADRTQPMTLSETLQSRELRKQRTPGASDWHWSEYLGWPGRLALLTIMLAAPWMFGAVYSFAQFYLAIGLMIAAAFWYLESAFSLRASQIIPYVMWLVAIGLLLAGLQTQTVAPWATQFLAGQQLAWNREMFGATPSGTPQLLTTLAIDPESHWRYTRLLIMGCAAVLLGARLFRRPVDVMVLLVAMTANGVALAFFGMIQRMSHNGKMYWVFESDYGGILFGPYVNRNNAAGFLLICLAAAVGLMIKLWSHRTQRGPELLVSKEIPIWRQIASYWQIALSELTATKLASVLAAAFIATGIIATLSRGGVLGLLAASIITLLVYGMARKPRSGGLLLLPLVGLVALLASWVGFADQLLGRFDQLDTSASIDKWDARLASWQTTLPHTLEFGVFGAGLGSYPTVHRLFAETKEIHLFEYAENQFVQTLVEAGIPGLTLLCLAVLGAFSLSAFLLYRGSSSHNVALGSMGVFLISGQVTAGLFDFGWYIPANLFNFAVLVGVMSFHGQSLAGRLKKKSWWRFETSGWIVKPAGLALIAALVFLVADYRGEVQLDELLRRLPGNKPQQQLARETSNLEQTQAAIAELAKASEQRFDSRLANRLGDLWVHSARWQMFEDMRRGLPTDDLPHDTADKVKENLWALTALPRLHEQLGYVQRTTGNSGVREFRQQPALRNNLPLATEYFAASLRRRPFQAETQMKLGQLTLLLAPDSPGLDQIDRAVRLAPGNANMRYMAALAQIFGDRYDAAFVHLKKLLELEPRQFVRTVRLLQGLTGRIARPVDNRLIADQIIPNDPEIIYDFLSQYLPEQEDDLRRELLDRAIALVNLRQSGLVKNRLLLADLYRAKGDIDSAIECWDWVTIAAPDDRATRLLLVQTLVELERFEEAEPHARRLLGSDTRNKDYLRLMQQVDLGLERLEMLEREKQLQRLAPDQKSGDDNVQSGAGNEQTTDDTDSAADRPVQDWNIASIKHKVLESLELQRSAMRTVVTNVGRGRVPYNFGTRNGLISC